MYWNFLLFVQVWPTSWLNSYNEFNELNYNFTNNYFTVHGIWPEFYNGSWPEFCNKTEKFNVTELDPIKKELEKFWTDFKDPEKFWEHEFYKHFTCSQNDKLIDTELKYFKFGLDFRNQTNLFNILKSNNIVPSNEKKYKTEDIIKIFENKLKHKIVITCDNKDILEEIRLCLSKDLNIIDCRQDEIKDNCKKEEIWFKKFV